jgi:NhaP-type Na+/H+ and K+/H+ antiporter
MDHSHPLLIAMQQSHEVILVSGTLGVLSVLAGLVSRRIGAPVLLSFLALGMLAGEDHFLGVRFRDFSSAYLVGSVALAVILFAGGLKSTIVQFRLAFWPAATLATIGVGITTGVGGALVSWVDKVPLAAALLAGAVAAPTDAAAVASLLRRTNAAVPERTLALLEIESGLNDPMSIFLTFMLLRLFAAPQSFSLAEAVRGFLFEMAGGAILGMCGGWLLAVTLRRLPIEAALANVLSLAAALVVFGLAQWCGASGFLATYLAGVAAGATVPQVRPLLEPFFEGMSWLAQIVLFLMLGLMVSPRALPPFILPAVLGTAMLLLARPVAVFLCLAAFRFTMREMAFASWVGLRGAVPIYVSLIPGLVDPDRDEPLFVTIFIVVITSLIVQGWTVGLAARWLGYRRNEQSAAATIARPGGEC